jgi:hypothetical protein
LLSVMYMCGRYFFTPKPLWPPVLDDVLHFIGGLYITTLISLWALSCRAIRSASERLLEEYKVSPI